MNFLVTGVFRGKAKATGNPFQVIHVVEIDRTHTGLTGYQTNNYYCTPEVADLVKPNCIYELRTNFGSKNVVEAIFIKDNSQ